jgi:hypothetical protein
MSRKSLEALRQETRQRVAQRAAGMMPERWTVTAALQRRARRKAREALLSMLLFGAAMVATVGAATAMGLV